MKGTSINIGGEKRYFKPGTNATGMFCEIHNMDFEQFNEVFTRMQQGKAMPQEVRDFIYCGLVAGCMSRGEDPDFTKHQVGDWFDDMDPKEFEAAMGAGQDKSPGKKKAKPQASK